MCVKTAIHHFGYSRAYTPVVSVGVEDFTPHLGQKNEMVGEAEIFLGDLELRHQLRFGHCSEKRMKRLAWLEVNRTILDLQENVSGKLPVEGLEIVVGRRCSIVVGLRVIDKSTPDYDTLMRSKSGGQHVGAVYMTAIVGARTRLAFAVSLNDEAAKVWDEMIDFISLFLPPSRDFGIERVCSL